MYGTFVSRDTKKVETERLRRTQDARLCTKAASDRARDFRKSSACRHESVTYVVNKAKNDKTAGVSMLPHEKYYPSLKKWLPVTFWERDTSALRDERPEASARVLQLSAHDASSASDSMPQHESTSSPPMVRTLPQAMTCVMPGTLPPPLGLHDGSGLVHQGPEHELATHSSHESDPASMPQRASLSAPPVVRTLPQAMTRVMPGTLSTPVVRHEEGSLSHQGLQHTHGTDPWYVSTAPSYARDLPEIFERLHPTASGPALLERARARVPRYPRDTAQDCASPSPDAWSDDDRQFSEGECLPPQSEGSDESPDDTSVDDRRLADVRVFPCPGQAASSKAPARTASERRVASAPLGSYARAALTRDVQAARHILEWLEEKHLEWLRALRNASRIASATALQEELVVTMSRHGALSLDKARRGIHAYDLFSQRHASSFEGGSAYPPTVLILAMFCRDALEQCEDRKRRRISEYADTSKAPPRPNKGTMAESRLKELALAHAIFGAPFPEELLDATALDMVRHIPPGVDRPIEDQAAWSVAFQIKLELLAKSELAAQPLNAVRAFAIAGITGLRTCELLWSKFTDLAPINDDSVSQAMGRVALILCAGGKPSRMVERTAFETLIRGAGFTGVWPWFASYVSGLLGKPYILRDFARPITSQGSTIPGEWNSGGTMAAKAWKGDQCAPMTLANRAFIDIAETSPDPVTASQRSTAHLSPYGSRHLLPSIARAANGTCHAIPLELANELGRWDAKAILGVVDTGSAVRPRKKAAAAMVLRYAPNLFKELQARDRVVAIITGFVNINGERAVPLHLGVIPSFEFLFEGADWNEESP